jgi:hypothetical protein
VKDAAVEVRDPKFALEAAEDWAWVEVVRVISYVDDSCRIGSFANPLDGGIWTVRCAGNLFFFQIQNIPE